MTANTCDQNVKVVEPKGRTAQSSEEHERSLEGRYLRRQLRHGSLALLADKHSVNVLMLDVWQALRQGQTTTKVDGD